MADRLRELRYWLQSDEPEAARWRRDAPVNEKAAALREYRRLKAVSYGGLERRVDGEEADAVENHAELA